MLIFNLFSKFSTRIIGLILVVLMFAVSKSSFAIAFGEPDGNQHPNVASVRFIDNFYDARISCTGALIHKDSVKYVILTAGHCAEVALDGWNALPAESGSVGVSFDEINLPSDIDPRDGGADGVYYVSGGTAFVHPLYRFPGEAGWNDSYDIAIVVLPINAVNSINQTIAQRWGNLMPVNIAPVGFTNQIIASVKDPKTLLFTAVGYGTGSTKSPQASGSGNKVKLEEDAPFLNRNHALVSYKNLNGEMINVDTNIANGVNTGYLCAGDSGGPIIYKDKSGNEKMLGVLTQGNCRSSGGYSRIDLQVAKNFIDCAFVPGDVNAVKACINQKFPS